GGVAYVPDSIEPPVDDPSHPLAEAFAKAEVSLLSLRFADLTVAEVASCLAERPAGAPFAYVVTPNADHLVRLHRDARLDAVYRSAALCLLDSRVVYGL